MKIDIHEIKKSVGLSLLFDLKDNYELKDFVFTSPLEAHLSLTNTGDNFLLQGKLTITIAQTCSRCAENFEQQLNFELCEEFVPEGNPRLMEKSKEVVSEEVNVFSLESESINISEVIRQNLIAALPLQPLCLKDCKGLCPQCGANKNTSSCGCETSSQNIRWMPLKKLKG